MFPVTSKQSGCLPPTGQLHALIEGWDAEHGDKIIRFLQRWGLPLHDAEDAKQETLRKASQWLNKGGRTQSVKGLLLTIAVNVAKDIRRKEKREGGRWAELDASAVISTAVDPLTALYRSEIGNVLKAAIETLQPQQHDVITWYYFDGYTKTEIGNRLGITASAVANRIDRALKRLRKQLSDFEADVIA